MTLRSLPPLSIPPGPATSSILDRIQRELRELWAGSVHDGDTPKSRVCTANLVVAASSRDTADRYTAVIDEVTQSIPSRAIIVALEPEAPTCPMTGEVAAVRSEGDASSERIRLDACGSVCARVASAVDALLVPEIPTTLVWLARVHVDDDVFASMAESANRVVLDTEYTSLASLLQLEKWSRERGGVPAVADMAWTRITIWQELCARFFDKPRTREFSSLVTRLTIAQACEPGTRLGSEAALFLGWIATRLGWRAVRIGGGLKLRRSDGRDVLLQFKAVPKPDGVAPAALASVTVEAASGLLKGSIDRELASGAAGQNTTADADVVTWKLEVEGQSPMEQRVRLRTNKGARVLERTLHRPTDDPALVESVQFAEHFFDDGVVVS